MKTTLTALVCLCAATAASAETVRYTYASEADLSRTQIFTFPFVSGPTVPAAGLYNGRVGKVEGTLDVETLGGVQSVTDFKFDVQVPHGLPIGLKNDLPGNTYDDYFDAFAALTLSAANGATVSENSTGYRIDQEFDFDTRYGPAYFLYGNHPGYDENDDTLYPFQMTLQFSNAADGSDFYLNTIRMTCIDFPPGGSVNASSCNGWFDGNFGRWNGSGTARNAISSQVVTTNVVNPVPTVPLPAAGWLLLAGVTGLMASRRRNN